MRHLSDHALLLLTTGEVAQHERAPIAEHLRGCADCQARLREVRELRSALGAMVKRPAEAGSRSWWSGRIGWTGAAAVAMAVVMAWTLLPKRLNAEQLLWQAQKAEQGRASANYGRVAVRSGLSKCEWDEAGNESLPASCGTLQARLAGLPWNWMRPLSVETYRNWRSQTSAKEDHLYRSGDGMRIVTVASQSAIRSAELTLSATNYRVLHLRLDLENAVSIEVWPETAPSLNNKQLPTQTTKVATERRGQTAAREADQAEVAAWSALGQLDLLNGWSAVLKRRGNRIDVLAAVTSDALKARLREELNKLRGVSPVISEIGAPAFRLDQLAPQRETATAKPALGEKWLESNYDGDTDTLTNDVLRASQEVLGYASMRQVLLGRRAALENCGCAAALDGLLRQTTIRLGESTARLRKKLASLFGEGSGTLQPLAASGAARLDAAILHVFSSAPQRPSSLDAERETISSLLGLTGHEHVAAVQQQENSSGLHK